MSKNLKPCRWTCREFDPAALAETIGEQYQLVQGTAKRQKVELYDSFDRPFIRNGKSLVRIGGVFSILGDGDFAEPEASSTRRIRHQRPVFWWDFEPGAFQDLARSRLKLRAALPLAEARLETKMFSVLNGDEKIVLRLSTRSIKSGSTLLAQELLASPLIGYGGHAAAICRAISKSPHYSKQSEPLVRSIHDLIDDPGVPTSAKTVIPVLPDEDLQSAVTRIAASMLEVARQSEAGVIDDIDTEFLHDYRVAIRKLRSVVTLVKGAYPPEDTRRLKTEFGDHARATNRLRDLDVYLLKESTYRERIPENLRPGLDRMFADFRAERSRTIHSLRRRLQSKKYLGTMNRRAEWFQSEDLPKGPRAEQMTGKVVIREIRRHLKHVRKSGMALTADTPDEEVHELRIECKRLRYLLELFASVFKQSALKKILGRLKKLQNVLGDFNDFSVQSVAIEKYLNETPKMDKHSSAAVGALIAILHAEQAKARAGVEEQFKEFCDGSMRKRFKTLFANLQTPAL